MQNVIEKNTFLAIVPEPVVMQRRRSAPPMLLEIELPKAISEQSLSNYSDSYNGSPLSTVATPSVVPSPPAATGRLTQYAKQKDEVDQSQFTTVMVRNIPCRYTQDDLIEDIAEITPFFNFVYLPPSKRMEGNVGYAFVNFTTPEAAQLFMNNFTGFAFPKQPTSNKIAVVVYAVLQGLKENLKFYKKTKVRRSDNRPYVNRALK